MATALKKSLKRLIKVHGIESDVLLTISEAGLEMSIPGFKTKLHQTWFGVAGNLLTPLNVPSFLAHRPLELLSHFAAKKKGKQK